jgi:AcrR family transcriptional regulator
MVGEKRRYDSPKRRQQAAATRARLLASAKRLFAARGYAATTIEAIANDADLAVPTVYAVYGSKRAVLFALLDEGDAAADLASLLEELHRTTDPRQQLRVIVDFNIRLFAQVADLLAILRTAASAESDVAAMEREGTERRRAGQAAFVRGWASRAALKPGLSEPEAADILWGLTSPDLYHLFVIERRWAGPRYGEWLCATLEWLLFGAPGDAAQNGASIDEAERTDDDTSER